MYVCMIEMLPERYIIENIISNIILMVQYKKDITPAR